MKIINNPNPVFWKDVVKACSFATFFHTDTWASVMAETFRLKDITRAFIFDDGTKAVLPILAKGRMFGLAYLNCRSMYPGVYGGVISEKVLTEGQRQELEEYFLSLKLTALTIVGNPMRPQPFFLDNFEKKEMFTHMLNLN